MTEQASIQRWDVINGQEYIVEDGPYMLHADHVEFVTGIIRSLMFAENGGDRHDVINRLCAAIGIPPLEGDYLDGWTDADMRSVGLEPEDGY